MKPLSRARNLCAQGADLLRQRIKLPWNGRFRISRFRISPMKKLAIVAVIYQIFRKRLATKVNRASALRQF
jgi:hypothetical protein